MPFHVDLAGHLPLLLNPVERRFFRRIADNPFTDVLRICAKVPRVDYHTCELMMAGKAENLTN